MFEDIKNYLENSTVHGLVYISTTRKLWRLFWILIVCGGFTGAIYLIHLSFQSWNESPIKTTIETLPISEVTFPKITVCPPKNTYTNLNYDLIKVSNKTLENVDSLQESFITHFQQLDYEKHLGKNKYILSYTFLS